MAADVDEARPGGGPTGTGLPPFYSEPVVTTVPALWLKHRRIAHSIARDYYLPGSEPQDVEQEALIALWVAARDHDPAKSSFPTFARLVITRRLDTCVKLANRHKHEPLNGSVRALGDQDALETLPHLHQVSDQVDDREQLRAVLRAIDHDLTDFERHCVIGIAAGLSYPEIDGNLKRVDNALMRARRKLRAAA